MGSYFGEESSQKLDQSLRLIDRRMSDGLVTDEVGWKVSGRYFDFMPRDALQTCWWNRLAFQRLCIDLALHSWIEKSICHCLVFSCQSTNWRESHLLPVCLTFAVCSAFFVLFPIRHRCAPVHRVAAPRQTYWRRHTPSSWGFGRACCWWAAESSWLDTVPVHAVIRAWKRSPRWRWARRRTKGTAGSSRAAVWLGRLARTRIRLLVCPSSQLRFLCLEVSKDHSDWPKPCRNPTKCTARSIRIQLSRPCHPESIAWALSCKPLLFQSRAGSWTCCKCSSPRPPPRTSHRHPERATSV